MHADPYGGQSLLRHHEPAVWPHRHMLQHQNHTGQVRGCPCSAFVQPQHLLPISSTVKDAGSNVGRVLLLKPDQFVRRICANPTSDMREPGAMVEWGSAESKSPPNVYAPQLDTLW